MWSCFRAGTSHQFIRAPSTPPHRLCSLSDFARCTNGETDVRGAEGCLDTHRSGSRDRTGTGKKPVLPAFSPVLISDATQLSWSHFKRRSLCVWKTPLNPWEAGGMHLYISLGRPCSQPTPQPLLLGAHFVTQKLAGLCNSETPANESTST